MTTENRRSVGFPKSNTCDLPVPKLNSNNLHWTWSHNLQMIPTKEYSSDKVTCNYKDWAFLFTLNHNGYASSPPHPQRFKCNSFSENLHNPAATKSAYGYFARICSLNNESKSRQNYIFNLLHPLNHYI